MYQTYIVRNPLKSKGTAVMSIIEEGYAKEITNDEEALIQSSFSIGIEENSTGS